MSFRSFVRAVELAAKAQGIKLSMARLRDAIARACYNRPYSSVIAAESAGKLGPLELPPPFLLSTAEQYGFDPDRLGQAFLECASQASGQSAEHPVLMASSLKDVLRLGRTPEVKRLRSFVSAAPEEIRSALCLALGTVAGISAVLANFAPDLLSGRNEVRVAIYCNDITLICDDGRLVQLASAWLATSARLQFDIILDNEEGDPMAGSFSPATRSPLAQYLSTLEKARFFSSPGEYELGSERPDIAVAVFPAWVDDVDDIARSVWLSEALRRGVRVLGMTYDEMESDIVEAAVVGHGLGRCELATNAAFGELRLPNGASNYHGRYLFRVHADSNPGSLRDGSHLARASDLIRSLAEQGNEMPVGDLVGRVIEQNGKTIVFGTSGRAVDIATGETYRVETRRDDGIMLRAVSGTFRRPWVAVSVSELPRVSDRVDLVEEAFGEPLFPPELVEELGSEEAMQDFLEELVGEGIDAEQAKQYAQLLSGNVVTGVDAGMPLFAAAEEDDADAVRKAIGEGEDVEGRDEEGWTPLAHAASVDSPNAARALLEAGADPNARTMLGHPALTIALSRTHDKTALVLLEGGADIDLQAASGMSARDFIERGIVKSPAILDWYRAHG